MLTLPVHTNHSEYSQYQEYLASLTEDSTQILQNRVFTQPGHEADELSELKVRCERRVEVGSSY